MENSSYGVEKNEFSQLHWEFMRWSCLKMHFIKGLKGMEGILPIPKLTTQYKLMKVFPFFSPPHMDNLLKLVIASLS